MRNNFVFGFGLVIIVLSLVLIVAPYFTAVGSNVWLDKTFVVPEARAHTTARFLYPSV